MAEVVFVDTSVLLNLLDVPQRNADAAEVKREFKRLQTPNVQLVLPLAAIVETGNFVAQIADGALRRSHAQTFAGFLRAATSSHPPWVLSGVLWNASFVTGLVDGTTERVVNLVQYAQQGIGCGDLSILHELDAYRTRIPRGMPVRVWTCDEDLKAHA